MFEDQTIHIFEKLARYPIMIYFVGGGGGGVPISSFRYFTTNAKAIFLYAYLFIDATQRLKKQTNNGAVEEKKTVTEDT